MTPRRVLVTGGAGFIGSALALRVREAWPDDGRHRLRQPPPTRQRTQPRAAARRRRPVRARRRPLPRGSRAARSRSRSAARMLGRAVGAGRLRRRPELRDRHQPRRHHPLPRAGAACRRGRAVSLHEPRLPHGDAECDPHRGDGHALRGGGAPGPAGRDGGGHRRGLPPRRHAVDLRRDQALVRTAAGRVPGGLRTAHDRQSLRRHRRAVADGQGRIRACSRSGWRGTSRAAR